MSHGDLANASFQSDRRGGSSRMATFHLTTECNLRCEYCYALDNEKLDRRDWDANDAEPAIALLAEHGYRLSLGGGEPTFAPDRLFTIARLAQRYGMPIAILTNGHLLDEPMMRALRDHGIAWVQVSVDHADDVALLDAAFALGRKYGIRMAAGSVPSTDGLEQLEDIYRMLCDTNAAGWRILKQTSFSSANREQDASNAAWRSAMIRLEQLVTEQPSSVQIRYEPGLVPLAWYQRLSAAERPVECGARTNKRLFLYPNGTVFSCGLPRNHAFFLGNYLKDMDRLRARLTTTPTFAAFNRTDGSAYCQTSCLGGCLQFRERSCDSRCGIKTAEIAVCCYEKIPLDPFDERQRVYRPSTVYAGLVHA